MTNSLTMIELTDKYGEKISSTLQTLADKLGVGADHFWPLFIRQ